MIIVSALIRWTLTHSLLIHMTNIKIFCNKKVSFKRCFSISFHLFLNISVSNMLLITVFFFFFFSMLYFIPPSSQWNNQIIYKTFLFMNISSAGYLLCIDLKTWRTVKEKKKMPPKQQPENQRGKKSKPSKIMHGQTRKTHNETNTKNAGWCIPAQRHNDTDLCNTAGQLRQKSWQLMIWKHS